jgi:hypothetical protein
MTQPKRKPNKQALSIIVFIRISPAKWSRSGFLEYVMVICPVRIVEIIARPDKEALELTLIAIPSTLSRASLDDCGNVG